jgi:hypothetical protein
MAIGLKYKRVPKGMTTSSKKQFRIFYSWQSDLPDYTNRVAIRQVLRGLRTILETTFLSMNLDFEVDEATRGLPGSPNIPNSILAKIRTSDAFVADISIINQGGLSDPKKTPNPNVIFELGFAVANLGWDRIILLLNETYGNAKELPFDIDRQRVSPYRLEKPGDSKKKLEELCKTALSLIVTTDPPKPSDAFDPGIAKRERDIRQITDLLQFVHWPTLDQHLEDAPKLISKQILFFWDSFSAVRNSATFHFYDAMLLNLLDTFGKHWHETTRFGQRYERQATLDYYVFTYSTFPKVREREEQDWRYIEKELGVLAKSMRELVGYLRKNYVELDLDTVSDLAWKRYQHFISGFDDFLSDAETDAPVRVKTKDKGKRNH